MGKTSDICTQRSGAASMMRVATLAWLAASLAGCMVGPDFIQPLGPDAPHFTPEGTASPGLGQRFVEGRDIPADWWALYRSKPLDTLVRDALEHNPSLEAAEAAIGVAYFNAEAQRGLLLPQVGILANESQNLQSNNRALGAINQSLFNQYFPSPYNVVTGQATPSPATNNPNAPYGLFLKQLSISYAPDIWGLNRRTLESLEAQTQQAGFQLEAARLALTSNVVVAAIQEASIRGQIEATKNIIAILEDSLEILNRQYSFGSIAKADVVAQEAALAPPEQALPPLEKQLALQRDLLTALAGRFSFDEIEQKFRLSQLKLPGTVPLSVPSTLVAQLRTFAPRSQSSCRDCRGRHRARQPAAEYHALRQSRRQRLSRRAALCAGHRLLHACRQRRAAAFRRHDAVEQGTFGSRGFGAGGRAISRHGHQRLSERRRRAALPAGGRQGGRNRSQERDAAKRSLDIVRMQLKYGQVSQIAVFTAQRIYFSASLLRVQAEATRLADTAALFMALGGGWWNCDPDSRH